MDYYLGEGEVGLEVWATYKAPAIHSKGEVDKDRQPGELLRKEVIKHADSQPHRLLLQLENGGSLPRTFTVTWTNPARFYSRTLTYILTVLDPKVNELAATVEKLGVVEEVAAAATEQITQEAEIPAEGLTQEEKIPGERGVAMQELPENI